MKDDLPYPFIQTRAGTVLPWPCPGGCGSLVSGDPDDGLLCNFCEYAAGDPGSQPSANPTFGVWGGGAA